MCPAGDCIAAGSEAPQLVGCSILLGRSGAGAQVNPQLVFLSPGPGSPTDFKLSTTIEMAQRRKLPIFGVCLGALPVLKVFLRVRGTPVGALVLFAL